MRTGIVLPTFRDSPDDAFAVAGRALAAGVDGVFCYDHLWPMGQPDRPAMAPFPILAALAAAIAPRDGGRGGPYFGTLVARVGLVPNRVLQSQFRALAHVAPGRIIAGLGTGDQLSEAENLAYGLPYPPAGERRRAMVALARDLHGMGLTVWLAGGHTARADESQDAGVALNLWGMDPALVAARARAGGALEVTWAGPPPTTDGALRDTVGALALAGATWVVYGWPVDPDALVEAARAAG